MVESRFLVQYDLKQEIGIRKSFYDEQWVITLVNFYLKQHKAWLCLKYTQLPTKVRKKGGRARANKSVKHTKDKRNKDVWTQFRTASFEW